MRNTPISQFEPILTDMFVMFGRNPPLIQIVQVWHSRFADKGMSFYEVQQAMQRAIDMRVNGDHPPTPVQVMDLMPGATAVINEKYLLDQLLHPTSSVGVLFCSKVGTRNIRGMGNREEDMIIQGCLRAFMANLENMTRHYVSGEGFSDRALVVLMQDKYNHIDMREFAGHKIPQEISEKNRIACQRIKSTNLLCSDNSDQPSDKRAVMDSKVTEYLGGILGSFGMDTPKPKAEKVACKGCGFNMETILTTCERCGDKR